LIDYYFYTTTALTYNFQLFW